MKKRQKTLRGLTSLQTLLIGGILLSALCIIIGVAYLFLSPSQKDGQNSNPNISNLFPFLRVQNNNTSTPVNTATSTNQVPIALKGGGTLSVRNFLNDPDVRLTGTSTSHAGYYILSSPYPEGVAIIPGDEDPRYKISYFPFDNGFQIAILREPINEVRREAVVDLRDRLGLSNKELCDVAIDVVIPWWVNEQYSTPLPGIPGCKDSAFLPGDENFQ
ncbi:hypothetical protein EPO56_00530 [Patescibacteria group bacterium]|nr:MAG: hypothetical protein EPO56_00530 [Patescibacteria group bacterium]